MLIYFCEFFSIFSFVVSYRDISVYICSLQNLNFEEGTSNAQNASGVGTI